MTRILTGAQMRAVDARAIDSGIPGELLMEHAGRAVFEETLRHRPISGARRYYILCGGGNNGGDGYVVARLLHEAGAAALAVTTGGRQPSGDAALMAQRLAESGCSTLSWREFGAELPTPGAQDVIVDAMLGTGSAGAPRGAVADAIRWANASPACRIAVDLPSGAVCDTGAVSEPTFRAELTVTFACEKPLHRLYPARSACGRVVVRDIGIPAALLEGEHSMLLPYDRAAFLRALPRLGPLEHKGSRGKLLIVAGSERMAGAALMAAGSALRSGCGYVTLAAPEPVLAAARVRLPEAVALPLPCDAQGFLDERAVPLLREAAGRNSAVLFGPGLGRTPGVRAALEAVLSLQKPLLLDADGLNALGGSPLRRTAPTVLTPHIVEFSRLTGLTVGEIEADPVAAAVRYAADNSAVLVLKGPGTIVAAPDGSVSVNDSGNPGLATAGSGDVLSGVTGAFLAAGLDAAEAARAAVFCHGAAGDLAAARLSQYGMTATDIIESLPELLRPFDWRRP